MTLAEETNQCSRQAFNASRGHSHTITYQEQYEVAQDVLLCNTVVVDTILEVDNVKRTEYPLLKSQ